MRISVVIPCYNSEAYLESTVGSLMAQTVRPFEILFLDDGSTNDTWERLEGFRSRHPDLIRIFRRPANLGYAMRHELMENARGDWIANLDHDDLWEPTKLEKQIRAHEKHPGAAVLHTDGWSRKADDLASRRLQPCPEYLGPADPFEALFYRNFILASSALYRRDWIERLGGMGLPEHGLVGDHEIWLRLSRAGARFLRVPEPLTTWRIQPTGQISARLVDHFRQLERMYLGYEQANRAKPRLPALEARRRVFKVRLDLIRSLLFRQDPAGHEEAADRWSALFEDWDLLDAHRRSIVQLMALSRTEAPRDSPSGEAPRGRWNLPELSPAASAPLRAEWAAAGQDAALREKIAGDTTRIFRMGGVNPPFARLFGKEEAHLAAMAAKAWAGLERRDRRRRWFHRA